MSLPGTETSAEEGFDRLVGQVERPLTVALCARYGDDVGRDAAAEALAWAWEHADELPGIDNPAGYLFRVGQSAARRLRRQARRRGRTLDEEPTEPWVEPELPGALANLSPRQRVAVVLCHGYGLSHREAGELLGVAPSSVQNHVERGMRKLRRALEVD